MLHSNEGGINLDILSLLLFGLFDLGSTTLWQSLFRYLVLSSELSVPYHKAIEDWIRANRRVYSRQKLEPVKRMVDHLKEGMPLFQYLREKRRIFPGVVQDFLYLVPDEHSVPQFLRIACAMLQERSRRNTILKNAVAYPAAVVWILLTVITVYRWKVLPTFSAILAAFGMHLPLTLQIQTLLSTYINVGLVLLVMLVACAVLALFFARVQLEYVLFRIPFFGNWVLLNERLRVLSALSAMSLSRIPWAAVVDRVSVSLKTRICRQEWASFEKDLHNGVRWEQSVENLHFLSPDIQFVLRQLPRASGELHPLLETTRVFYESKRREVTGLTLRAFEPVLILILGIWVGLTVYSMYRPFSMVSPLIP